MQVLITVAVMALLVFCIFKKYNVVSVMMLIGIIGLLVLSLVTGTSVMGDSTVGSPILDVFEKLVERAKTNFTGTVLILMALLGYVNYMDKLKANEMFSCIATYPLRGIKNARLLVIGVMVVGLLCRLVITSGSTCATMLIATLYPLLRNFKVSKRTAATAILSCIFITWGPVDAIWYTVLSLIGDTTTDVSLWFVNEQIPVIAVMFSVYLVVFYFVSRYWDNKEKMDDPEMENHVIKTPKDVGVPYYYGLLPLLPLIFILIFSKAGIKTIVITPVAAAFLSFFIAAMVRMASTRKIKETINEMQSYFDGMGSAVKGAGAVVFMGTFFAVLINSIGGIPVLVDWLFGININAVLMVLVVGVIGYLMVAFTGSASGSLPVLVPLMDTVIKTYGLNQNLFMMFMVECAGVAVATTPITPTVLIVTGATGVDYPGIVKYMYPPLIVSILAGLICCFAIG